MIIRSLGEIRESDHRFLDDDDDDDDMMRMMIAISNNGSHFAEIMAMLIANIRATL